MLRILLQFPDIQANKNSSSGNRLQGFVDIEYGAFKIRDQAMGRVTRSRAPGCGSPQLYMS